MYLYRRLTRWTRSWISLRGSTRSDAYVRPAPGGEVCYIRLLCLFQLEDDTEVKVAEAEMDEVDRQLGQSPRKYEVRRRHKTGSGSRLGKMLSKYKTKLDYRCNGSHVMLLPTAAAGSNSTGSICCGSVVQLVADLWICRNVQPIHNKSNQWSLGPVPSYLTFNHVHITRH